MTKSESNPSVETIINESAGATNSNVEKNEDSFYIILTGLALTGLVTLLILALY